MKVTKKKLLLQQKQSKHDKIEKRKVKKGHHDLSKLVTNKIKKKRFLQKAAIPIHVNGYNASFETSSNPFTKMLLECDFEELDYPARIEDLTDIQIINNNVCVHAVDCEMPDPNRKRDELIESSESYSNEEEKSYEASPEQSFISEKSGEYQLHHIPQGAILLLHANSRIFIHGHMQMKILHGEVEILGKILHKTSPPAMLFSPRCSAYLYIQNKNLNKTIDDELRASIRKQLVHLGVDPQTSRDIVIYKLKPNTVIAYCENVADKATEFLENNLLQKIYPMLKTSLQCTFKNYTSPNWNPLLVSSQWEDLVKECKKNNNPLNQILLCGGKGVGKSTLLRYLVNTYLNDQEEVYVLDLDPGQPEFTVPGSISVVKVTSPLLGPNYTHLQECEITLFIPLINVAADHHRYLSTVEKIMKFLPLKGIVIINYMGFTKGLGMFLLAAVINILNPHTLVELISKNDSKNYYQDLTLDNLRRILSKNNVTCENIQPYVHMKLTALTTGSNDNGWELGPKAVRDMCVLSYMSKILPGDCTYLTDIAVDIYRTSLTDITILNNGRPCDPLVANGNLVALCKLKDEICIGWGIVRAVSKETNTLFLITPIGDKLKDVAYLVIGSVTLPPAIYLRHSNDIQGNKPYISEGELSHFGKTPKRSIYPKMS